MITDTLLKARSVREKRRRCNSVRIGSRWYRAPEIILMEHSYDQASDMWSFGVILYELIQLAMKSLATFETFEKSLEPGMDFMNQRHLFKGASCFPMSPKMKEPGKDFETLVGYDDQMVLILKALGT